MTAQSIDEMSDVKMMTWGWRERAWCIIESDFILHSPITLIRGSRNLPPDMPRRSVTALLSSGRIVPRVTKFIFYVFQNGDGGHLGFRGQDVSKSKNNLLIGFFTPKIVEFNILYFNLNVYILLSSKKVITFFSKLRWRPYWITISLDFSTQK